MDLILLERLFLVLFELVLLLWKTYKGAVGT